MSSFKECPRCLSDTLNKDEMRNALSRRDNKTYICSSCGVEEALIDASFIKATVFERSFVEKLLNVKYEDYIKNKMRSR